MRRKTASDVIWPPPGWIDSKETARRLGLSVAQVTRYLSQGKLSGKLLPGGWIIRECDVDHFQRTPVGNPKWRLQAASRKAARERKSLSNKT